MDAAEDDPLGVFCRRGPLRKLLRIARNVDELDHVVTLVMMAEQHGFFADFISGEGDAF